MAQEPGSWRSLALAVRFGRWGAGGVVRTRPPEKGPSAGQRNGQRRRKGMGHLSVAHGGLEPYGHAWSHDRDSVSSASTGKSASHICLLFSGGLIISAINRSKETGESEREGQEL